MTAATMVRSARRSAHLTQRELAHRSGVAQPTIARIERGLINPRVDTLERILSACGRTLSAQAHLGIGIDRTQMRELLALTPIERLELLRSDATGLDALDRAAGQ